MPGSDNEEAETLGNGRFYPQREEIFGDISSLSERLADDRLYEIVAEEISQGDLDPVAQLKALEEAKGDEGVAKANYARHRIRRLTDLAAEYAIIEKVVKEEAERKAQEEAERKAGEEALSDYQFSDINFPVAKAKKRPLLGNLGKPDGRPEKRKRNRPGHTPGGSRALITIDGAVRQKRDPCSLDF